MFEIAIGILSGLASAVTVAGFLWSPIASLKRELKKVEGKLETERLYRVEADLKKLDMKFEKHLEVDNPAVVANEFKHINGTLEKLCSKMDRVSEDVAQLKTSTAENEKFTRSLHATIKEVRDRRHKDDD